MASFLGQTPTAKGAVSLAASPLGRGGEGEVFAVAAHEVSGLPSAEALVAKVYHAFDEQRVKKLVAMIVTPPEGDSVAWPLALLLKNGQAIGYLMKKLPRDSYRMWAEVAHSQQRKASAGEFDVKYALTVALNLAYALETVHSAGHCVGDVNESNIFVGQDASVLLVDTDSAQIKGKSQVFPCLVGKAEFTAAELSHGALKDHRRTVASDVFAYAVASYQLLLGGPHPTDGIFQGVGDPPPVQEKIRRGVFPNLKASKDFKPVPRVASEGIPSRLVPLFLQALSPLPEDRPALTEIASILEEVLDNLKSCGKVKQHWFDGRDRKCGWCSHAKGGNPDPWNLKAPKPKASQRKLPPVKFLEEAAPKKAKRAPRALGSGGASPPLKQASTSPKALKNSRSGSVSQTVSLDSVYSPPIASLPKHKGKTVLTYADGTSGVRPPLGELWGANSKVAWRCFVNEVPEPLLLGWRFKKKLTTALPLFCGLVFAFLVAGGTFFYLPPLAALYLPVEDLWIQKSVQWFSMGAALLALLGPLAKVANTLRRVREIQAQVGSIEMIQKESFLTSFGKVALSSILYGVPILAYVVLSLLWTVISGIITAFERDSRR